LQVLVGLASGTFYPLALSYSLRSLPPRYTVYAIGPYSMELLSSLSIATPMHAWFMDHLSWRWIFWTSAVLTPIMMLCIHPAIPPPPKRTGPTPEVSWRGFLFISLGLALIEGALEQGERLDWLGSPIIIAMFAGGAFMLVAGAVRRWMKPNPLVNLSFLLQRNILILGGGLFTMRFGLLTILVLVPGYLGAVQGYRPLETGRVLLWLAIPALVMGVCAARLMKWIDSRVVLAIALCMVRRDEEAGCGSSGVRRQRQVGRALKAAARVNPPSIEQMANCTDATRELYVFGYRGSSGSVHSAAWVLASHAAGAPPLPETRMLHDVLMTAMVTFEAAGNMLEDDRLRQMAARLQQVVLERSARALAAARERETSKDK